MVNPSFLECRSNVYENADVSVSSRYVVEYEYGCALFCCVVLCWGRAGRGGLPQKYVCPSWKHGSPEIIF